jgi:hypothetical protein
MKEKVITYLLLTLFLFSTIGVPISLHYCQMMKSISLQSCEMCEMEMTGCCKDSDSRIRINSIENDTCCNTKYVAEPSTEKFLSSLTEIQKFDIKIYINNIPAEKLLSDVTKVSCASDNSPPDTYTNTLYLNNSILLI